MVYFSGTRVITFLGGQFIFTVPGHVRPIHNYVENVRKRNRKYGEEGRGGSGRINRVNLNEALSHRRRLS